MSIKKIIGILGVSILTTSLACGCSLNSKNDSLQTTTIFAMDTVMELQVAGDESLLADSVQMITDLENKLSVTSDTSEIGILNSKKETALSEETTDIFEKALEVCKETDGDLDISIYPVLKAWGFTTSEYRVPEDEEIDTLLVSVDYRKINENRKEEGSLVTIPQDMEIDLGSIVKGYTGSKLSGFYRENGVKSALINLGGNVECIGTKPNGQPWNVAVKSPFLDSKSGIYGVIKASDEAIITSGGYERYFESNGEIYWHILDPKTGKPAKSGLSSVTIIGKDGLLCDGLSTALFVKGLDEAIAYWKTRDDFDFVLITDEGQVFISEGIADRFSLSSEYHDAPLTLVTK